MTVAVLNEVNVAVKVDTSHYEEAAKKATILSKEFAGIVGVGMGRAVKSLIEISDKYTELEGRLRLVTKSTEAFNRATAGLYDIAKNTRVEYTSTVDLYTRLARSTQELGVSQNDLLTITEAINKALIVSGASGESANAALTQLGQGMASGTLRGEELNSVLKQMPRLAQMIADGMGVTIGELRELGKQGKLTSETVVSALKSQASAIDEEFRQMPVTVGQAWTKLNSVFESIVNEGNKASGTNRSIAKSIVDLAETIDQNRDGIIGAFIAVADSVTWLVDRIGAFGQSYIGLQNVMKGNIKWTEYILASPEEMKQLNEQAAQLENFSARIKPGMWPGSLDARAYYESQTKKEKNGDGCTGNDDEYQKQLQARVDALRKSLMDEKELLDSWYNEQLALVRERYGEETGVHTEGGELRIKLAREYKEKLDEINGVPAMKKELQALQDHFESERDRTIEHYDEKLALVAKAREKGIELEMGYDELEKKLKKEKQDELTRIEKEGATDREKFAALSLDKQADYLAGYLTRTTSGVAQHNKAMFEVNKAAGIAQAIINTYQGASEVIGNLGMPWAIPFVAATVAAGMAQVNAIASTSFSGGGKGGAATSAADSTGATSVADVSQTPVQTNAITVYGIDKNSLYSGDQIEAIAEGLNEYMADGGKIYIK